ncbi:retrotransposon protein [Cucumis melo var. makuwa]|uniref:Retrotransposon protein n=1 Tax=Cucumis melo var. makuwa TaxID=1194695 RepID=A0A5A7SUM8_CUCMM|nr:retrotransposon protein [Cucumis melo var. makuwa]
MSNANILEDEDKGDLTYANTDAKGFLNKPFPHYDELSYVFEKDRAIRARAEMFSDIGSNVPGPSDGVQAKNILDMEFLATCRPRMNMSLDMDRMTGQSGRSDDCRSGSNNQKRKCDM